MLLTSQFEANALVVFIFCFVSFFLYFYIILLECIISIASRKYLIYIYRQYSIDVQHKFVLEVNSKAGDII